MMNGMSQVEKHWFYLNKVQDDVYQWLVDNNIWPDNIQYNGGCLESVMFLDKDIATKFRMFFPDAEYWLYSA